METKYEKNIGAFKALADVNRLMIVDMLSCGELCACKILEKFHITQPTLSHHMKLLCESGLVNGRKEGKWMMYSLNDKAFDQMKEFLNAITTTSDDCICVAELPGTVDQCTPSHDRRFSIFKETITMKKMSIYEPAMCCETGLCGVSIDPELLRISTVLNALKTKGIEVGRFNLSSAPMEFVASGTINKYINDKGVDGLPVITVDGEIVLEGRYPTNEEFMKLLSIPEHFLSEEPFEAPNEFRCC